MNRGKKTAFLRDAADRQKNPGRKYREAVTMTNKVKNLKFKMQNYKQSLRTYILSSKYKTLKVFILVSSFYFLFSNSVLAQSPTPIAPPTEAPTSGINLSLSPTFLTLRTDPGKNVKSEFKIRNNNSFPEYLKLGLVKFETGEDGQSVLSDITEEDEFASWVEFEQSELIINPQETKTIPFTISPPASASLGYYYGILVSRIQEEEGEGTVISGSTALPVLLEVNAPNAKKEIQILSFKPQNLFYEYPPVTFEVTFENTGNVHASPVGDIFIDSMGSQDIAALPVNIGRGNILPGGKRTFTATFNEGFALRVRREENGVPVKDDKGNYIYETKYDFSKANEFRFGRYTAHLLMVYDNGERDIPVEATVSFWIIPWKIILGVIVAITGPAFVVYLFMKWRYGRRK